MQVYSYTAVVVYWHYSNGNNRPGAHRKICRNRQEAREWVRWMEENIEHFVFDEMRH